MNNRDYSHGARRLVTICTDVQQGERVLIVRDASTSPVISTAIADATREVGGVPVILEVEDAKTDSGEPSEEVRSALLTADVVFAAVQVSITHTRAVQAACKRGSRVAALTQWVPEMLLGGGIDADFRAIEPTVLKVAGIFDRGSRVTVKTRAGTDMVLDITGREATPHAKTGVVRPGEFHPIPDIEAPVSPVTGSGIIVCDASIPYLGIGLLTEPVVLRVEDGRVVSTEGGEAAAKVRGKWESLGDPNVYHLAELGIGMNPEAVLTGRMLDDEGVATTCHFGIGTSETLGGDVKASSHFDFVINNPTIVVDDIVVMEEGRLRIS